MLSKLKLFAVALCALTSTCLVEAQSPPLSVTFASQDLLQLSWPSNFTNWQLVTTTNLPSAVWQIVPLAPFPSNNAIVVFFPIADLSRYFRLQEIGAGTCQFQATPPAINSGQSSTLTWCPLAGYTYQMFSEPGPGPGVVTGNSLVVSPTSSTVYTLTASNSILGVSTEDTATVICNPCGWLQVSNVDFSLAFIYRHSASTASYNFNIDHTAFTTFHLHRLSVTATDAYYYGFATGDALPNYDPVDTGSMEDREDDKTGSQVFTTTEVGGVAPVRHDVSTLSLHITCTTYDFSYNVLIDTTETSQFGTTISIDGVGTGVIRTRALDVVGNKISDSTSVTRVPAIYPPPPSGDYFVPSSDLGKAMFTTGTATAANAGNATLTWEFNPVP